MNEKKWSRRKDDRPTEIIEVATCVFIKSGYAAANLDEVARQAGIAKGTLYRYFDGKDSLFRAVVQQAIAQNKGVLELAAPAMKGSLAELIPRLLTAAADTSGSNRAPALARLVIAESQAFPDLAKIWHDEVVSRVLSMISELIRKAQELGEVREGDPTAHAFSIVGPMLMALLFRDVFGQGSAFAPDMKNLAEQHSQTILNGLLTVPAKSPSSK